MAKGRKKNKGKQHVSGALQDAYLEKVERQIETNISQRAMQQQIVKCTKNGRTLNVFDGTNYYQYEAVDMLTKYTARDFIKALDVGAIDMSGDLNPASELTTVFSRFASNIDEEEPNFRLYMRNSINTHHFCMLQRCIEQLFLDNEPMEELQGWILQYSSLFIFGSVHFNLEESVQKVCEACHHIMSTVENENNETEHKLLHQLSQLCVE